MARYSIVVSSEEEYLEPWADSAVPNMSFWYEEETWDECEEAPGGGRLAHYESMEIPSEETYTYADPSGKDITITVPAGEYGIRPNSSRIGG